MAKWKLRLVTDWTALVGTGGLTSEAARTVRDHGFRDLKLDYVISLIHPENHPSLRVAAKNGMILERETTFRGFATFVFAITRERWLQLGCGAE